MKSTPVTVVYLEDDADDVKIFHHALSLLGLKTTLVHLEDGYQGLQYLLHCKKEGNMPALVITDVNMPRMNGVELIEKMKKDEVLRKVPVVALSTSMKEEKFFRLIDVELFQKADNLEQFMQDIKTMFEKIRVRAGKEI